MIVKRSSYQNSIVSAVLMLFCLALPTVVLLGLTAPVIAAERDGELSGEHDTAVPKMASPGGSEPERKRAGADQNRPSLKLPEVVVQGDRQYRVTAERRDLLLMDPMWGTKEMPADIGKVAVPGLDDEKGAPAADTITAKNYLFSLEAGGGSSRLGEARVLAGYEFQKANCVLRADYLAEDHPLAYAIRPFDQKGNAELAIGFDAIPATRLTLGVFGRGESNRQPENRIQGWGDWMERASGKVHLRSEIEISNYSKMNLVGSIGNSFQQGIGGNRHSVLKSRFAEVLAEFEQDIQGLTPEDLNLFVRFHVMRQEAELLSETQPWKEGEFLQKLLARFRFRPVSALHLDLGVRIDEFSGVENKNTSDVVGQASLVLPFGTVLYGQMDAGLDWDLVSEWSYEHPRQAVFGLPRPERVIGKIKAGWRQRFGDQISSNVVWFQEDIEDIAVWLDGNRDGLFTLVNLSQGKIDGSEVELEIQYSRQFSQIVKYTYRQASYAEILFLPNIPEHEANVELRVALSAATVSLRYRYLGQRYGDPAEKTPSLAAAHLAYLDCDFKVLSYLNVFIKLENILGVSWDKWLGYPGRTFNGLAGARISF
jgi:TonB-dependent receptor-like protein